MEIRKENMDRKPLIFITNDDGIHAKGLETLIEILRPAGRLLVVAPERGQSGMAHAITMNRPLTLKKIADEADLTVHVCNGTPVDCVKIAFDYLLSGGEYPSLAVSGINHGSNSAINVLYSGTMGAAVEASFYGIPSIGFSILDHAEDADFTTAAHFVPRIVETVVRMQPDMPLCLNVNIPCLPVEAIKGIRTCRQTRGFWREDFERRQDPRGNDYYWLSGHFCNAETTAEDTDEWALAHGYVSVVPVQVDLTDYRQLDAMKKWKL